VDGVQGNKELSNLFVTSFGLLKRENWPSERKGGVKCGVNDHVIRSHFQSWQEKREHTASQPKKKFNL
jgi:fatty acid/phospholipid biosynthesis enzyme